MYFLFSGEGPTDTGICHGNALECHSDGFDYGPMVIMVDHIVEVHWDYSLIESLEFGCVSRSCLVAMAGELRLPGAKSSIETTYFYRNARALALCAKKIEQERNCVVIAVLFRDTDTTASAGRGLWRNKWDSIIAGFEDEDFERGVPMIPKPIMEAWLICALKEHPYTGCEVLEDRSGSDKSPNPLKAELSDLCGGLTNREALCEMVRVRQVDVEQLGMPSFSAFRKRLEQVLIAN
jgi:hypothetical protein